MRDIASMKVIVMSDKYEVYEYGAGHTRVLKNDILLTDFDLVEDIKKLQAENAELNKQSQWISVEDELPSGKVLMSFLEPLFGSYYQEVGVGYYDSPDDYENPEDATGWRFWIPDKPVVGKGVTHWMPLPTPPEGD